MRKSWFILLVTLAVAGIAWCFLLQHRAEAAIRQNEDSLRQQREEIERTRNRDVSADVVETDTGTTKNKTSDYDAELAQLRSQAAALRARELQLSNEQWSSRLSEGVHLISIGNSNLTYYNNTLEISMAGGPRPNSGKVSDGRAFAAALRKYAAEHGGQFPSTLEQVTAYLPRPLTNNAPSWINAPVSGTNDFEIVYQGTTNELGNIPARRVALLRERQPWLTPDGKWARAYAYADGAAEVVASDDNFESWDAVHVVPPPANP